MNPIFSYVDPVLLFKEIPPYEYLFFILYKPENTAFRESFRQSVGRYHVDSGKNIGLFVFDPLIHGRWLNDNFEYFLKRYKCCSSAHADWKIILDDVSKSKYGRPKRLREWLQGSEDNTIHYMSNFMKLFNIDDSNLPVLLVFNKKQPTVYYLKTDIGIGHIDSLLYELTSQGNYKFNNSSLYSFPDGTNLAQVIEMLNDGLSSEYWTIVDSIRCLQLQKDISREPLKGLVKTFPVFNDLKYPDYFEWHKDLIKWLKRYNNLVEKFVHQLNILIETPENRGLGLEKIRNFYRFRVSDKYRSHYFERNGKKVCYFLGDHDYQLR